MKKLIIVIPNGEPNLISVVGAYKIFTSANEYRQSGGKKPIFNIQLAGTAKKIKIYDGLFTVTPELISTVDKADLVIIPAISKDYENTIKKNLKLIEWIKEQHQNGAEVASICIGAFLLAATGLVDGKKCSTHWIAGDEFRKMFPKVEVITDKVITDDSGIYTNGGAMSFMNLMLYLIEKYYDRETAIYCSKVFQVDIDRESQNAFTIFTGLKNHKDELVKKAQKRIEKDFQEKIVFEELATDLAISRRNFDRRFIHATGNTPAEYLQRVKVEAAKRRFESSRKNINEVMYEVGYLDTKAFRTVFKKITGLSPIEYRNKYNGGPSLS